MGDDDLVVDRATLEVEELHANWLRSKDVAEMVTIDAVAADEAFEDMKTLWGENVDATVLEEI